MSVSSGSDMSISSCDSDSLVPPPTLVFPLRLQVAADRVANPFTLLTNQVHTTEWLRAQRAEQAKDRELAEEKERRRLAKGKYRACEEKAVKVEADSVGPSAATETGARVVKLEPEDSEHVSGLRPKPEPIEDILPPPSSGFPVNPTRVQAILPRIDSPSESREATPDGTIDNTPNNVSDSEVVLDEFVYDKLRFVRGRLSGFPSPFNNTEKLPVSLCVYRAGYHGYMYTSHWMFPLPNSNDILVIACNARKREKIGRYLDMISLDRTAVIEVAVANDQPGGLTYLGSFMPKNEWYSFTEANIGRVQGLLKFWSTVSDPRRVDALRLRWETPNHTLTYCHLKHVYFNQRYFDMLEHFTKVKRAAQP